VTPSASRGYGLETHFLMTHLLVLARQQETSLELEPMLAEKA
jgi:hypothetical protein